MPPCHPSPPARPACLLTIFCISYHGDILLCSRDNSSSIQLSPPHTMSKLPPGCVTNGLVCYKCNCNDFGNFNNSRNKHGAHVCWCKGIPSSNQTQLKSNCKRKSALNDYHCSGTKLFPFLMKQPPVDKDDVPLAFQFDDMANDTDDPPLCNNNDNILSIMLPADDKEDVTHCPENMSQHFNIGDSSLQPTFQSLSPYNSVVSLPPNYQFQIDLQAILSNNRINLKLQDEIVGLLQQYSHDKNLTFSTATLSSRSSFMTKLERTMMTLP